MLPVEKNGGHDAVVGAVVLGAEWNDGEARVNADAA